MPIDWAYRWSNTKWFNTAVLRIRKGSELASHFFTQGNSSDTRALSVDKGYYFHPRVLSALCSLDSFCRNNFVQLPTTWFDPIWSTLDGVCDVKSVDGFPRWITKFSDFLLKPAPQEDLDAMNEIVPRRFKSVDS
mmetsp:Transcript_18107/g.45761  ORF Transcript_18107/g.45761 Transcript_18107/m.45761 type:complete len:135 (+) Transcript_18107:2-406(+)